MVFDALNYPFEPRLPELQMGLRNASADNLSPALEINGQGVLPVFRYKGGDASASGWDAWGFGESLAANSVGGVTFNDGSPLLGSNDDSVLFDGTGYYKADNSSFADVSTEDLVVELVLKLNGTSLSYLLTKRENSSPYQGVLCTTSNGRVYLTIDAGASNVSVITDTLDVNVWYHVVMCINRDENSTNGSRCYVNGIESGSGINFNAANVDISNDGNLVLNGNFNGSSSSEANIAYAAMWKKSNWHQAGASGPTEWAAIAEERVLRMCGVWPEQGNSEPTFARDSIAVLDKQNKLYQVGAGWPRIVDRDGQKGYLAEPSASNLLTYSQEFNDADWTKTNASVVANSAVSPDGVQTADTLHEDATAAVAHQFRQSFTGAGSTPYTLSVWVKAINRSWVMLRLYSATDGLVTASFNLSTGATGTVTADSAGIEYWGSGWYRCWIEDTRATAETQYAYVAPAEADDDITFDGLDQDSLYVWGAQLEVGASPTSYIKTEASSVTRNDDVLALDIASAKILDGDGKFHGTVECQGQFTPCADEHDDTGYIYAISDGTNSNLSMLIIDPADRLAFFPEYGGGAAHALSSAIAWGTEHNIKTIANYDADVYRIYLDSLVATEDADLSSPIDLDKFSIGCDFEGNQQIQGGAIFSNWRIVLK
jgi:hypothetical protein